MTPTRTAHMTRLMILAHTTEADEPRDLPGIVNALVDRDPVAQLAVSTALATDVERQSSLQALVEVTVARDALAALEGVLRSLDPTRHTVLEVDTRTIASYERTWKLRSPSPGERMVTLVHRTAGTSRDDFARHWRDVHAPIAMSFTINPSSYTQNVTVRQLLGRRPEPDGVMVMHFLDPAHRVDRWSSHPDEAARGAADAATFMDMNAAMTAVMHETIWK